MEEPLRSACDFVTRPYLSAQTYNTIKPSSFTIASRLGRRKIFLPPKSPIPPCSSPSPSPLAGLGELPLVPLPGRVGLPAGFGTGTGLVPVPGFSADFGAFVGSGMSLLPLPSACFGLVGTLDSD